MKGTVMTQHEIATLLDVPERTLRGWKHDYRRKLYALLENLQKEEALKLLDQADRSRYMKVLENEKHFDALRDFERYLYPLLLETSPEVWSRLAKDRTLSHSARARSAYLYTFLTGKKLRLKLEFDEKVAFFHKNRPQSDNRTVRYYGLKNGLNAMRFTQFRETGLF